MLDVLDKFPDQFVVCDDSWRYVGSFPYGTYHYSFNWFEKRAWQQYVNKLNAYLKKMDFHLIENEFERDAYEVEAQIAIDIAIDNNERANRTLFYKGI